MNLSIFLPILFMVVVCGLSYYLYLIKKGKLDKINPKKEFGYDYDSDINKRQTMLLDDHHNYFITNSDKTALQDDDTFNYVIH